MSHKNNESNGFLAGLVFGAIIGGAMALFLGGEEGKEARENLRQKSKVIFKNLGLMIDETVEEGAEVVEEGKQEVKKVVQESKEEVTRAVDAIKNEGKKSVRRFFLKAGKKLS